MKQYKYDFVKVDPMRGEHRTAEYRSKFPVSLIPALEDGNLRICESAAILTYLCDKNAWRDWLPTDLERRARINQYLHWHVRRVRVLDPPHLYTAHQHTPTVHAICYSIDVGCFSQKRYIYSIIICEC